MNELRTLLLSTFIVLLCHQSFGESPKKRTLRGKVVKTNKELLLPEELGTVIEKAYLQDLRKADPIRYKPLKDIEILSKLKRKSLDVSLKLENLDRGALNNDVEFSVFSDGGVIDLYPYPSKIISGRFLVKFNVHFPESMLNDDKNLRDKVRVYFISNSRIRTIGRKSVGSGCNKFSDMTGYFKSKVYKKGIMVDTFNDMHVSTLAGTFYFMFSHGDELMITAVSFIDSKKMDYQCRKI